MIVPEPQDYIAALEKQRNDALNLVVNLQAENAALQRALAEKQAGDASFDA